MTMALYFIGGATGLFLGAIIGISIMAIAASGQYEKGFEDGKELTHKHGHWIGIEYDGYADGNPVYDVFECSVCHDEHYGESDTLTDYCPACGAKMDEEGEEE